MLPPFSAMMAGVLLDDNFSFNLAALDPNVFDVNVLDEPKTKSPEVFDVLP
jgi:hypothetical protein